jgi:hypothetical protein
LDEFRIPRTKGKATSGRYRKEGASSREDPMSQLYLPVEHTEADLVLAGQIAESIDSAELYVTWTPEHGHAAPEVSAELRQPAPTWRSLFVQAIRELWAALRNREPAPGARATRQPTGQPEAAA